MKIMMEPAIKYKDKNNPDDWKFFTYAKLVDGEYIELLGRRAFVYFALSRYVKWKSNECWPSYNTIMKKSGYKSKTPVSQAIIILEDLMMIKVRRSRGRVSNRYELLEPKYWRPANGLSKDTVRTVLNEWKKRYRKPKLNSTPRDTGIEHNELININNTLISKEIGEKRKALGDKWRIKSE